MSNWRENIINKIKYSDDSLIFVKDRDYLFSDETLIQTIEELGCNVLSYSDNISFRYVYETRLRMKKDIKIVIYINEDITIPYDFSKKSTVFSIDLSTVFPKFSAPVLRQLNREDMDALYTVHAQYQGSSSTYETLEYIVKQLYKIPFEIIDNKVDLYKILLSIHYRETEVPMIIKEFLFKQWESVPAFTELPLQQMIFSAAYFYQYIQNQWIELVDSYTKYKSIQISDTETKYESHPFKNYDVRRLMNDLFLEGVISKVNCNSNDDFPDWMKYGIETEQYQIPKEQVQFLLLKLREKLQVVNSYRDWFSVIQLMAEYKSSLIEFENQKLINESQKVFQKVNDIFYSWMLSNYHSLASLAPFPTPKMVHHIPHILRAEKEGKSEKVALLVLDGMSFIQWKIIKKRLEKDNFLFEENGVFVWVPTLTSISRQAIFSGSIPLTYSSSLNSTSKEEKQWKSYWENNGVLKQYVGFQKGMGTEVYDKQNFLAFKRSSLKVFGLVVDVIDKLIHSTVLGEKGLYSQLDVWLQSNYLQYLLNDLQDEGYTVYITSDHGNTTCTGIGRVSEGVLVNQKGERVRVYDDKTLFDSACQNINGIPWSGVGLPENYHILLAKYGESFTSKGEQIVTHGGISIEETIVPFIKVLPK